MAGSLCNISVLLVRANVFNYVKENCDLCKCRNGQLIRHLSLCSTQEQSLTMSHIMLPGKNADKVNLLYYAVHMTTSQGGVQIQSALQKKKCVTHFVTVFQLSVTGYASKSRRIGGLGENMKTAEQGQSNVNSVPESQLPSIENPAQSHCIGRKAKDEDCLATITQRQHVKGTNTSLHFRALKNGGRWRSKK
jgi:hypothetical protein